MKVIGIVGSPRKGGNTEILTAHTLKAIREEGLETELVSLAGLDIKPCNACRACAKDRTVEQLAFPFDLDRFRGLGVVSARSFENTA